jgi:hypothetical protein
MDKQKIFDILGNFIVEKYYDDRRVIRKFPKLRKWYGEFILGSNRISLDDTYSTDELEALVYVMRHTEEFQ